MNNNNPTEWLVGTMIHIVKLAVAEEAQYQTCSWKEWKAGELNDGSPPVDYEVRGLLMERLELGRAILVARTHRNHVESLGVFISTPVREFKNGAAVTMNSIYVIRRVETDSVEGCCA